MTRDVYISITGLRIERLWNLPTFWAHATRSMAQARAAAGNISAEARTIGGVHHTLSVWTDRDAMRAYLATGPHREAMRVFPRIATGMVAGYFAPHAPDWSEVHAIWLERGRVV
jgi:quinol monooxygenase YgiN